MKAPSPSPQTRQQKVVKDFKLKSEGITKNGTTRKIGKKIRTSKNLKGSSKYRMTRYVIKKIEPRQSPC